VNGLEMFIVFLALSWLLVNLLYKVYLHRYKSISIKYGVLFMWRKFSCVKPSRVINKAYPLWIVFYVIALGLTIYTIISAIYIKFAHKTPAVVILIPGVSVRGIDLLFMLTAIFISALAHEYMHAKVATSRSIRMRGFGVLIALILPLAFIELDEESFESTSKFNKVLILAAGVAANILLYLIAMLLILGLTQSTGLLVTEVSRGSLAEEYGIRPYDVILAVNGTELESISILRDFMSTPENIVLKFTVWRFGSGYKEIAVFKPANITILGISATIAPRLGVASVLTPLVTLHLITFTTWLYIVNFSLALINSMPLYITDGGRIANIVLGEKGGKIANTLGIALLALLLASSRL